MVTRSLGVRTQCSSGIRNYRYPSCISSFPAESKCDLHNKCFWLESSISRTEMQWLVKYSLNSKGEVILKRQFYRQRSKHIVTWSSKGSTSLELQRFFKSNRCLSVLLYTMLLMPARTGIFWVPGETQLLLFKMFTRYHVLILHH